MFAGRRLVIIWPEWSIGYCGRKLDLDRSVNADQINQVNRLRLVKSKIAEAITFANLTLTKLDVNSDVTILFGSLEIKKV